MFDFHFELCVLYRARGTERHNLSSVVCTRLARAVVVVEFTVEKFKE